MAMRDFVSVVQQLVGPMIGTAALASECNVVAPQLVGHHNARLLPSAHQIAEKPSGPLGTAAFLKQDVQHVAPVIDSTP